MSDLNYHHLRYFHAVAHDGNLTRTAEKLHLSQSALSIQIKQLEARLGHALFERQGRQLILTEAGRLALDHADRIFAVGSELLETIKRSGATRRPIRIGALATLSRNFQMEFLRPLIGRPDVEVILRSGRLDDLLKNVENHNLDIVLVNHPPAADAASPFLSHLIAIQPVSLVGRPAAAGDARDLAQMLSSHPLILPTLESGVRQQFDALASRLAITPQIAAEVEDMAMMRLLAREGAGLAVLPPIVIKGELETGELVEFQTLKGVEESFFAVTLRRKFPNPLIGELLQPLDERVQQATAKAD